MILAVSLITHILMATKRFWVCVFARLVFAFVHQTPQLCHAILLEKDMNLSNRERLEKNVKVLSGLGLVFGPILGGYLLRNLTCLALVGSVLMLVCLVLLKKVDPEEYEDLSDQTLEKTVKADFQNFKQCNWRKNWDVLLLKYCFTASFVVFLTKFKLLLLHKYNVDSMVIVGFSIAYVNCIVFFGNSYTNSLKDHLVDNYPVVFLLEIQIVFLIILSILTYFAPNVITFFLVVVPFLLLQILTTNTWDDLLKTRLDTSLSEASKSVELLANLTIPYSLCLAYYLFGYVVVFGFICGPLVISWFVVKYYTELSSSDAEARGLNEEEICLRRTWLSNFCLDRVCSG